MARPRKVCLAANWKMNQSVHNLEDYLDLLKKSTKPSLEKILEKLDMVLGVPSPFLGKAQEVFSPAGITVSAQNIHWEDKGAFTGETSCSMLTEIGVQTTIIGHSERRTLFKESHEDVRLKFEKACEKKITPILCVGENIEERKAEKTFEVLEEQLSSCLKGLDLSDKPFLIAYEPVWAIGTGLTATPEQAHEAHSFIRNYLKENFGETLSQNTRILYGGSMKAEVTAELLQSEEIDGGLIGGASLKADSFASMLNIAYELSL